jgi:hypothetical protein
MTARREFALVVVLGVVAAGLVLVALRQTWVVEVEPRPAPFPDHRVERTGAQLVDVGDVPTPIWTPELRLDSVPGADESDSPGCQCAPPSMFRQ